MIFSFPNEKNKGRCHLFITIILCILFLSFNLSMAANTHDITLGQALDNVKIVTAPKQTQDKRKKENKSTTASRTGKRNNTGSVQTGLLDIYSGNTVGGTVKSRHGATVAIGAADLSRIKADKIQIQTTNTVGRSVNVRDDETRFRMGTVDVSELDTGRLNIKTGSTIKGNVSVSNGQDVSIGVVELGTSKNRKKKDKEKTIPRGMQPLNDFVHLQEINSRGHAVNPVVSSSATNKPSNSVNQTCRPACTPEPGDCCQDTLQGTCYDINGCSTVADILRNNIFGIPGGPVFTNDGAYIPCNSHDQCYQTCGTNKRACDLQLYYDMVDECRRNGELDNVHGKDVLSINELEEKSKLAQEGFEQLTKNAKDSAAEGLTETLIIIASTAPETGGATIVPALEEGARKASISFIKKEAKDIITKPSARYTDIQIVMAVPHVIEGLSIQGAFKTNNIYKKVHELNENLIRSIDNVTHQSNVFTDKITNKSITLVYDAAAIVEEAGKGIENLIIDAAAQITPQESITNAVQIEPGYSCTADPGVKGFFNFLGCKAKHIPVDVSSAMQATLSMGSWAARQGSGYLLNGTGKIADAVGSSIADDIRFVGILGAKSSQHIGHAIINLAHGIDVVYLSFTDQFYNVTTHTLASTLRATGHGINKLRSLVYDCLSTAETYFIGVDLFGRSAFRGNGTPCSDNSIDMKYGSPVTDKNKDDDKECCVVNPHYKYHLPEGVNKNYNSPQGTCQQGNYGSGGRLGGGGGTSW